jgi:hypothetical protein
MVHSKITFDGILVLTAQHEQEGYALAQWYENAFKGKCEIIINPTKSLQLGPQVVGPYALGMSDEKRLNDDAE